MSAPKGNEFWKLRSKHGRDKLFSTPELLWEAACEYFQWCVDNPLEREELIKSGQEVGKTYSVNVMRPFTIHGLCIYLDCSTSYFRNLKHEQAGKDQDFLTVIERIQEVIYNQKFEGAAAGFFNANIISRDLGLAERTESHNVNENLNSVSMADVLAAKKEKDGA